MDFSKYQIEPWTEFAPQAPVVSVISDGTSADMRRISGALEGLTQKNTEHREAFSNWLLAFGDYEICRESLRMRFWEDVYVELGIKEPHQMRCIRLLAERLAPVTEPKECGLYDTARRISAILVGD